MKRPALLNRWPFVLALVAGAGGGACSTEGASTQEPSTNEISNQLQNELDTAAKQDSLTFNSVKSVRPVLKCVEKLSATSYKAHFGYSNTGSTLTIPVGFYNRFWPSPINRGQPTTILSGTQADVAQVPFSAFSASVWVLGTRFDIATKYSKACITTGGTGGAGTGARARGARARAARARAAQAARAPAVPALAVPAPAVPAQVARAARARAARECARRLATMPTPAPWIRAARRPGSSALTSQDRTA
jgi:hypothetical protein